MATDPRHAEPGAAVAGGDADQPFAPQRWGESLRRQLDPVGWRLVDALARRAADRRGAIRGVLDRRLQAASAAHDARCRQALAAIGGVAAELALRCGDAGAEIERLRAAGDLRGLRRLAARLDGERAPAPLAELVRTIDRTPAAAAGAAPRDAGSAASPRELRTLSEGRQTWLRIDIDRQLKRSLASAPGNPGPFNSHQLVVRALQEMDAVSPAYLQHFVGYAETLCWLDAASFGAAAPSAGAARRDGERKRRGRRAT